MSSPLSGDLRHADGLLVVVCGYRDGMLANSWFRAYRRLKRTVKLGGFKARVELAPVTDLPPNIDVLAVPPSLADVAHATPGVLECLVTPAEGLQQAFDQLVERLVREGPLEYGPTPGPAVAVHRGFQALTERARLFD